MRELVHDNSNSYEIIDTTPSKELANLFNTKKYFYSYDSATFLSLQAAMCGCISIIIPTEDISAQEWHKMSPTRKYGISYGFEEIDYAISTMDKVKPHLESLENITSLMVDDFIERTQKCAALNIGMDEYEDKYLGDEEILRQTQIQSFYNTSYANIMQLRIAENYISNGDFSKAKEILKSLLKQDNQNIDALNNLSVVHILENNFNKGIELINTVLELDPQNDVALDNKTYLGKTYDPKLLRDFTIKKLESLDDYKSYMNTYKNIIKERKNYENKLSSSQKPFQYHGYCTACGEETDFLVDYMFAGENNGVKVPCWRERIICPKCSMNNRMRSFVHYVQEFIKPDENTKIYMTEQTTPLYKYYSQKFSNCIGSEYLGDIFKSGTFNEHNIRNEDITALSFDNETFDLVFSLDVLEHVPNYKKAFQEINRVLKPGGSLIFTVPFAVNSGKNIIRAIIENNKVKHILPPEYHGDPINSEGCLCFQYFGWELMDILKEINYSEAYASLLYSYSYGYLGGDSIIFLAKKSIS